MPTPLDTVEIKDPPLEELKKKRSCLKQSCLTGAIGVIFFLGSMFIILKLTTAPNVEEVKNLPSSFPKDIPVYDKDNIHNITVTYNQKKGRLSQTIAYIPKVILSPIFLSIEKRLPPNRATSTLLLSPATRGNRWQEIYTLIKEPLVDDRDTVQIEWTELTADSKFVADYYQTELTKQGYKITATITSGNAKQFTFSKGEVDGSLYLEDAPEKKGTDYATLVVNIPSN